MERVLLRAVPVDSFKSTENEMVEVASTPCPTPIFVGRTGGGGVRSKCSWFFGAARRDGR
jgi:hypothetical protein